MHRRTGECQQVLSERAGKINTARVNQNDVTGPKGLSLINENTSRASSPPDAGRLDDPFKYWPNSDLLIDEEDRAFFARHFPAFATIFDWPELRALFEIYEAAAAGARKHRRRGGVLALLGMLS